MNITYVFDMDGTIADLYGVENWLEYLIDGDPYPYANAKPMCNFSKLAKALNKAKARGDSIEIISWLSKNSNGEYDMLVTEAKLRWLKKHLPSVTFDNIYIVPYGTPKHEVTKARNAILFDDEERNREEWLLHKGYAFTPDKIFDLLERK